MLCKLTSGTGSFASTLEGQLSSFFFFKSSLLTFGSLLVSSTVGITDILGSSPSLLRQWQQCQSSQLIKCYLMYIICSSAFDQHYYLFLLVVISMVSVFLGQAGDSSCQLSFFFVSVELVLDWASPAFFFCFFQAGVGSDSAFMT